MSKDLQVGKIILPPRIETPADWYKDHICEKCGNSASVDIPCEATVTNANSGGTKYDQEKIPLALLSSEALFRIGEVLAFGAKKYDADNWRKGISFRRVTSALLRHILAWNEGEDFDPETGLSHIAHAGCCVMFLLEYLKTHPEMDDRFGLKK